MSPVHVAEGAKLSAGAKPSVALVEEFARCRPPHMEQAYWFAASTCARHEKRVAAQLQNGGVECFLPLYEAVHRWKDRRAKVHLPLFPGYLFVHIAARDRLRVLNVAGVVRLVSFNGEPAPLPDEDILRFREKLSGGNAEPHPYLQVGRRVRVKDGSFQGMEGILKRKKDHYRLIVSIELVMRSIALDIDGAEVEPI